MWLCEYESKKTVIIVKCVIPENIHTPPPTDGQWKFLRGGVGGLKGRNFLGVWGVPTRRIFHSIVKDAIDRTRQT